ncbi:hypothetical protein ADUPG1_003474, partial [Aduncisulcus paluster]
PIVKPVLKCSGDKLDSYTINSAYEHLSSDSDSLEEFPYADGSAIIDPPFLRFKACADFLSKESRDYDQSSNACAILTRNPTKNILVSRISIHFRPCFLSGAHVCVNSSFGPPSLLFTFTSSTGQKSVKKYLFERHSQMYGWFFLPIGLSNVVSCDIEGQGMWEEEKSRCFGLLG